MRKTRLGIGSFCYPYAIGVPGFEPARHMDAFGLVDRAVALSVPVVQIADNYPLHLLPQGALFRLRAYAEERGVALEVGARGITAENLSRYISVAETLGAGLLRFVIDAKGFEPDVDEAVSLLKNALPALERAGVILGIENHDRFPASVFADIIEAVDSPHIGIVLDTVNSFACQENPLQVIAALARHTVCFHVKDFTICRVPGNMGLLVTGTVAGKGLLHIPEMLHRLRQEAKTDFSTVLELWMQPECDADTTVFKEDRWVKESIAYLKAVLTNIP